MASNFSRREHLKMLSLATAGVCLLPNTLFSQSVNIKLNIALIGGGGIARTAFGDCIMENVVAIADVDEAAGAPAFNAFPKAKRYKDFRKLYDAHDKELDLVIINTPDHTHFAATFDAMQRGIAVHTQKPLVHNIWQARTLQKAAHKFNVKTVMGNQGHNYEGMRQIKDWYDSELVGEVKEIHAWTNRTSSNISNALKTYDIEKVPSTLDWGLWQGPVKHRGYNKELCHKKWRWQWEYGLGALGDIGCHTLDIPEYVMGLGYPSVVYIEENLDFRHEYDDAQVNEDARTVIYEFEKTKKRPAVKLYWYEGGRMPKFPKEVHDNMSEYKSMLKRGGIMMVGAQNTILSHGMRPDNPRLVYNWNDIQNNPIEKTTPRAIGNPVKEMKAAIRGEIETCSSNFDYAARLTEIVLLGTIAIKTNKRVIYNPKKMTFADSSLNGLVYEPAMRDWEYGKGIVKL